LSESVAYRLKGLVLFSSLWPIYIAQGFDDLFEQKPMNGIMAS